MRSAEQKRVRREKQGTDGLKDHVLCGAAVWNHRRADDQSRQKMTPSEITEHLYAGQDPRAAACSVQKSRTEPMKKKDEKNSFCSHGPLIFMNYAGTIPSEYTGME